MFNRKIILIYIMLLVGILAISNVSASEIANDTSDLVISESYVEEISNDLESVSISDDEVYEEFNVDDVYVSSGNPNTVMLDGNDVEVSHSSIADINPPKIVISDITKPIYDNGDLIRISQSGANNQNISFRAISSFNGQLKVYYETLNPYTGEYLTYEKPVETYYFNKDRLPTITLDLSKYEPGRLSFYVIKIDGNEISPVARTFCYITKGVDAPDVTKMCGGKERFSVTVTDNDGKPIVNSTVTIIINEIQYTRKTNDQGVASIALNLDSGEYEVISISGKNTVFSKVTVKPSISSEDITKIYRNGTQYAATFIDSDGNPLRNSDVIFNINGVYYTRTTDNNGIARMNINLNPGQYILTAMNPSTGEKYSSTITILPNIVENKDLTKYYKNDSQYSVKLINENGKPVGEGENVTFNINGKFYTRTTDENGIARMNINLGAGEYIITAEYKGCRQSNKIVVLPILSANDLKMGYQDGSQFKVTLLDGNGNPYKNQLVTFNINGVFYNRTTDQYGQANLNINLKPGEYVITSSHNGFSISNRITILKDSFNSNDDSKPVTEKIIEMISNNITTKFGKFTIQIERWLGPNYIGGINIFLLNSKGEQVNPDYYSSKLYINNGTNWQWSNWTTGSPGGFPYHKYSLGNDMMVQIVSIRIKDGLSDDGYSFYPTSIHAPDVDHYGVTREYAIAHNMHYIPLIVDGEDVGGYTAYDPVNGSYHT